MNRFLVGALVAGCLVLGSGLYAWSTWRYLESTDNAYVGADIEPISAKIAGYVAQVLITDNQAVKAGQVLVRLDPTEYEAKAAQARAAYDNAQANLANLDSQLEAQRAQLRSVEADKAAADAELHRSKLDRDRFQALGRLDNAPRQKVETTEADLTKAQAAIARNNAAIAAAQAQLQVIETSRPARAALVAQAKAAMDLALDDLSHVEITAATDGVVGHKSVVPGQYIRPGAVLLSVVPISKIFVDANFKETQLTHMAPGQSVKLVADAYPGITLTGHVLSFAPASGAIFSLLPPENATGNFTKVVQRVPIRIALDDQGPLAGQLRPGLSMHVTVDTASGSQAAQLAKP